MQPTVRKLEECENTGVVVKRCNDLKEFVASDMHPEMYTEAIRVYTDLKLIDWREQEEENALFQPRAKVARPVAPPRQHPPMLFALLGDPDNNVTIWSSMIDFGLQYSPDHSSVFKRMITWIGNQTNKCASVQDLVTEFKWIQEMKPVWGEFKTWPMLYQTVLKVSCGKSVILTEETKAINKHWAAVNQRAEDVREGRAVAEPPSTSSSSCSRADLQHTHKWIGTMGIPIT